MTLTYNWNYLTLKNYSIANEGNTIYCLGHVQEILRWKMTEINLEEQTLDLNEKSHFEE